MDNTIREILISNLLTPAATELDKKVIDTLQCIRRDKVIHPVITVSSTTSSKIIGIDEIKKQIEEYLDERSLKADILEVGSLGISSLEPLVSIQIPGKSRVYFKHVNPETIHLILDSIFNNFVREEFVLGQLRDNMHEPWEQVPFLDEIAYFNFQQRLLLSQCGFIDVNSIEEYIAFGGYQTFVKTINQHTPAEVCDIVEQSMLRGRGGEGYCTGKKWKIAASTAGNQKYLICNAGESDPGAFMERLFMESDPHKIIESIAISAYAIGAHKAFIYIESDYELAILRIKNALDQAASYGLLGHDIMGTGYSLEIIIKQGAGAYVCGEETALIKTIEGKRGKPHSKPPYPATKGLYGQPTVVNNIETLLNIPVILKKGADWYKSIGTGESKGTKVFSISGKIENAGLVEVEMGTKIRDIIFRIAGGIRNNKRFKAVHIGGPSGGCLTEDHLDTTIDFESIMLVGASLGSASLVVLDEENCIIDTVKYFMNFLQKESCGICIPCREGTRRMFEILENISKRPKDENGHTTLQRFKGVMQLETLAEVLKDTSMCGLGRKAANPVLSTLKWFRDEYEEHIFERNCSAGVCQELRTFEIDVDACTGCTLCAKKCPTGAIFGTPKNVHFIVQDKCIGCGICFETCKFSAIISK
ncbi:MAG: NADH-ubiquinone oxidoreductase-F iron-sulfur binding region domain-containing protein [Bacteroidales bacterium]|jgi:NADH:ubiquinone oxidoreductase subunit F (NADH-binding)|nr:NADH-ubiquinone oxidoreductase-F iron-sulfur binding region domain-containing protein [Bacteroidales bacterium]